jgi:UDP-N-acetylmuramate dehydrogenase
VLLLGGGSNLLVADSGFPGSVIRIMGTGAHVDTADGAVTLRVDAGEPWDALVARTVAEGWSGLEALSGIPGSTGATPIQNVGAYGAEVAHVLAGIDVLDRRTGEVGSLAPGDLGLGYRTSRLKRDPQRWVVLSVTFRLAPDPGSGRGRPRPAGRRARRGPGSAPGQGHGARPG